MAEKITESDHVERAASRSPSTSGTEKNVKFNKQGIALIPQPSDDPRDPLVRCSRVRAGSLLANDGIRVLTELELRKEDRADHGDNDVRIRHGDAIGHQYLRLRATGNALPAVSGKTDL